MQPNVVTIFTVLFCIVLAVGIAVAVLAKREEQKQLRMVGIAAAIIGGVGAVGMQLYHYHVNAAWSAEISKIRRENPEMSGHERVDLLIDWKRRQGY